MTNHKEFIDYAAYCMNAERALKNLHEAILMKKFETAKHEAMKAVVESKLTYNAILAMEEDNDALHKQAATV
ncbi:MAG: hypothetical protein EBR82_45310 [Caulobacteraceae bacterium]|jgi:hypothetical protein|nr:hypothetical protein [Caulobacteraceae bacterium]